MSYNNDDLDKLAKAEKAKQDAQKRFEDEERIRRQREASERARLEEFRNRSKSQGQGKQSVDLNVEKIPTARRMEPPKTKASAASNRAEIKNIKDQVRMSSSNNNKLSMKQSLGKTVASGAQRYDNKLQEQDTVAKVAKEDATMCGKRALNAMGAGALVKGGEAVSAGLGHLQADDSAQEMTKIAGDIATKGANNVIFYRENCVKRAEEEVRKQARKVDKLDKKYNKLNSKELKTREKAGKSYDKSDKYQKKADKASAKGKTGKADKYSAKANKHSARGDKLNNRSNKLRDKRSKKNMKLGKKRGKAVAKLNSKKIKAQAVKKWAAKGLSKALLVKVGAIVIVPVAVVLMIVTLVGGGAGGGAYLVTKFVSEIFDFLSLDWTPTGRELARLEAMNWAQFIADDTTNNLSKSFIETSKKDAKTHYTEKKISMESALNQMGLTNYPIYDWYCDLGEGSIGSVWMREQCDNITDKNGQMIYDSEGNPIGSDSITNLLYPQNGVLYQMSLAAGYDMPYHYESNASNRMNITPNANIIPIMSLAHDRYTEEWTWENYEVVEAYVWYMYTLSHNSAHYDDSVDGDSGTYTYTAQQMCQNSVFTGNYLTGFKYDPDSFDLKRPGTSGTSCTNVYIHGYSGESLLGNATVKEKVKAKAKSAAKTVLSWVDAIAEAITGDDSDLASTVMQAGTCTITYERDSETGLSTGTMTAYVSDDNQFTGSFDWIRRIFGVNYSIDGTAHYCNNMQGFQLNSTPSCGHSEHNHGDGCVCSKEIHDHTSGCNYTCGKTQHTHSSSTCTYNCGKTQHTHTSSCTTEKVLTCTKEPHGHRTGGSDSCYKYTYYGDIICGKEVHSHNDSCYEIRYSCGVSEEHTHQTSCCSINEEHTHTIECCSKDVHPEHNSSCCTIKHTTHQKWHSITDPGCYDTFAYCAGHCGGHAKPTVNLAITYTMEGLAYQDAIVLNAGTKSGTDSSWTGKDDFSLLLGKLENTSTLKEWADITNKDCSKWFEPGPNGAISGICYIGETIHKGYLKVFRGWRDFWKGLADKIFGGGDDEGPKYNDAPSDQTTDDLTTGVDDHKFEGWFEGSKNNLSFKRNLFRELHDLYGDPDDFYQAGIKNWKDFDVQFNIGFGQVLTDERIDEIVNTITNKYYTTDALKEAESTKYRLDIVREALKSCGYYYYSNNTVSVETPTDAHFNGMYGKMGTSDGLGFVSGIYMRTLGSKCGWWYNVSNTFISPSTNEQGLKAGKGPGGIVSKGAFYSMNNLNRAGCQYLGGINNAKPGDILVKNNTDEAAIFLGYYYDEGLGLTQYYIVDCSYNESSNNSSAYRGLSASQIGEYNMVYRADVIK